MTGGNNDSRATSCQVRVGVRVRPLASKEIQQGGKMCLSINQSQNSISIASQNTFTYDAVFDSQTDQDSLYQSVSSSLLESFVEGYNATILAYGQTSSGKTYTMGSEAHTQPEGSSQVGLIPRFISDFFQQMHVKKQTSDEAAKTFKEGGDSPVSEAPSPPILLDYSMNASFLEVYGEDVYDLLDSERKSLPLREDSAGGVVIAGLKSKSISNLAEALHVLHEGTNNRTTAATLMNLTSSRSHAVFTIYLTQKTRGQDQVDVVSTSKFTFVDLAGSERMKKTGAEGERAREGIKINEGLLALGNVINALADEERLAKERTIHVPYRQSKLTRLLQDALGGNSQTLFLACVSPSDTNVSETLSTLRYANRARNIRNVPTKNLDATTSELQRLNVLTRVLQCELIKARFQDGGSNENFDTTNIGHVDANLAKRPDVEEYMEQIHKTANELSGVDQAPKYAFKPIPSAANVSTSSLPPKFPVKVESSVSALEATPNKFISERFDDSFLVDVNPDEDIAILDRLLELQQHDDEFDKEQKRDHEKLRRVDGELQKEEALLLQLRESLKAYHSLKKKYEELMAEVQQLEAEKASLAAQLEKATADPSTGCSAAIKRQLEKVELSLNRARRETLSHRQKYKAAEDQARRCQVLERKISDLKQAKINLLKKQKETAARYKETSEAKTKELLALKRKEKAADARLSKMKTEIQHHKSNLEKRKQYCDKLTDKLKQTETHLMKLLSIRQRDLVERASLVGKGVLPLSVDILSDQDENVRNKVTKAEHLSSEDLKSIQFIFDKMVSEKIEQGILMSQYKERVAEYSETMRLVVANVKLLKEKEAMAFDDDLHDDVSDLKETIADLELKLELLGAEVKEMESLLPDEVKRVREEEAVKKLMSKMPAVALRKMLFDFFSKMVEAETERRSNSEMVRRKDAALSSIENELDLLHGKVESLTRDLAERRILMESGEDLLGNLKLAEEKNIALQSELSSVQDQVTMSKERLEELEGIVESQKLELENTKDCLVLTETSLSKLKGSVESEVTLKELQEIWKCLGVDSETREKIRNEIRYCVSDTCQRHLDEATELKAFTEEEVNELRAKKVSMQAALRIQEQNPLRGLALLEEAKILRQQVGALEASFNSSNSRRERIISDMVGLSAALGISKHELPGNLQTLMHQIEEVQATGTSLGRLRRASMMENVQAIVDSISSNFADPETFKAAKPSQDELTLPPGSLEEEFLSRCEADIADLRVRKSELLVQNRECLQRISGLVRDLHSRAPELVELVEMTLKSQTNGIPIWWDRERATDLLKHVSASPARVDSEATETKYIETIVNALSVVARSREKISTVLRGIVEKAQQTLLDIVGRELDASEAYASFHEALLKLPILSVDFSHACISEMEALVHGVEAMMQSEIEALTVVWEALKVSSSERRVFWGRIDNPDSSEMENGNPFDNILGCLTDNVEAWIDSIITKGRQVNEELESKLSKLDSIHKEVERLRSKQDTKSQVLSLDSEIRILNSRLLDFEELQCSKQRLLTKKSGSTALLKEARFRKQMKAKFVAKLGQLASLLRSWEQEEGCAFNASLLSDDVRMLLNEPDKMEDWIEKRTKLMPSRTVPTMTPRKRSLDEGKQARVPSSRVDASSSARQSTRTASGLTPPRKKQATSARQHQPKSLKDADALLPSAGSKAKRSPVRKRKPTAESTENKPRQTPESNVDSPAKKRSSKPRRKESAALPPFGRILSEISSPDAKGTR